MEKFWVNLKSRNLDLMWIIWMQWVCFCLLNAIWFLPETIFMRHILLGIGALIGSYHIYHYRKVIVRNNSSAIYLLFGLFLWVTLHPFLFSNDFEQSMREYQSIWKRTFLGAVFALGLGVSMANLHLRLREAKILQGLIYLGLIAPAIIYIVKRIFTILYVSHEYPVPEYMRLSYTLSHHYVAKAMYVAFCIPALGAVLGFSNVKNKLGYLGLAGKVTLFITVLIVSYVFLEENIKNGMIYSALVVLAFTLSMIFHLRRACNPNNYFLLALIFTVVAFFSYKSYESNNSWRNIVADYRVAIDTETYNHWKYNGKKGYPDNELGVKVSATNYERIAWAKVGLILLKENPMGYGLIEQSFGKLAVLKWPDTILTQTHSGWIDLSLGLGVPGVLMLLTAIILTLYQLIDRKQNKSEQIRRWRGAALWSLFSLSLCWVTTENSQKILVDQLIFYTVFSVGLLQCKISN